MPQVLDDVNYLASEIGPRPAGTEEEQQAALYITEQFQKEAGFTASIEDFKCPANYEIIRIACFGAAFLAALVGFLVNITVVSAICIVISVVAAVLYVLETKNRPVLSKLLAHGISQNVIAKYEPHAHSSSKSGRSARSRKVILVASYDSGRVEPENKGPVMAALPILMRASGWALVVTPVLLLLNTLFFSKAVGVLSLLVSVVIVLGIILMALRTARAALHMFQPLNDGANFNASGTAALLEVARRIGNGRLSEAEIAEREAVVHDEEEAREAGLIPEGVEVSYEAEPCNVESSTEESSLEAAKAAIAALTGQRASSHAEDIAANLVQVELQAPAAPTEESRREQNAEIKAAFMGASSVESEQVAVQTQEESESKIPSMVASDQNAPVVVPAAVATPVITPAFTKSEPSNVPDWYAKAKSRARREKVSTKAHRSRYADALAQAEVVAHENEAFQQAVNTQSFAQKDSQIQASVPVQFASDAAGQQTTANSIAENRSMDVSAEQAPQTNPSQEPYSRETAPVIDMPATQSVSRETPVVTPIAENVVSRETVKTPEVDESDVSRETPSETAENETYADVQAHAAGQVVVENAPVEGGQTVAMAPIDVSDLLQEMSDMKAPEMKEPGFVERFATGNYRPEPTQQSYVEEVRQDSPDQTVAYPPISLEEEAPAVPAVQNHRAPIVLPDVPEPQTEHRLTREVAKQRAPLADAAEAKPRKSVRDMLSSNLPEVQDEAMPDNRARALQGLSNLPSFSGIIGAKEEHDEISEHNTVSATGSFSAVGATGSFTPVGDELVADLDPNDVYVEDADDSDYSENFTETGAFAGPGYMDMPKSRAAKLFDKLPFGRKKKKEEIHQTPQEWLDVAEDFDARTVGRERGGWESFQTEDPSTYSSYDDNDFDDAIETTGNFDPAVAEYSDDEYEDEVTLPANSPFAQRVNRGAGFGNGSFAPDEETGYSPRKWNGGAVSVGSSSEAVDDPGREEALESEFHQIYQFRNPDIDTEVWFVALGSQLSGEAGMKAFMQEHASELRGSIVINLESLGDGALTFMEKEGIAKTCVASSRMKRYIKKASSATGVSCATSQMLWRESAASVAMSNGVQAMTLAGVEGGKPAHYCDSNDTVGKVNQGTLERNIEFLMAILKNI